MPPLVAAIDIGTGSARAGIFDPAGQLLARAEHPIDTHAPEENHAEQDATQIWQAACTALQAARREAAARPEADRGPRLRRHLQPRPARRPRRPGQRLHHRRGPLGHHALARPPRRRRGRGMHRLPPPRPRLHRRRDVAGDGDPEAHVAEAPPPRQLGPHRPGLRSQPTSSAGAPPATRPARSAPSPASGPTSRTRPRAGSRISSPPWASPISSTAPASPPSPAPSPPTSARSRRRPPTTSASLPPPASPRA